MILLFISILLFLILLIFEIERNKYPKVPFFDFYTPGNLLQKFILSLNNAFILFFDKRSIIPISEYNELKPFVENYKDIQQEVMDNVSKFSLTQANIFDSNFDYNPDYGYYFLKFSNHLIDDNLPIFPKLYQTLKKCSNIRTCFFSIIRGRKNIPTHRGPSKGLLRFHLPIYNDYPEKNYLQVKDKKLYWNTKPFLFDDTFYHKLVKNDNGMRISLICDVERHLPTGLQQLNKLVQDSFTHSNFVKERLEKLIL